MDIEPLRPLRSKAGVNVPETLKALALFPADSNGYEGDVFMFRNNGERMLLSGGAWSNSARAGLFSLNLNNQRSGSSDSIGFRCAYFGKV